MPSLFALDVRCSFSVLPRVRRRRIRHLSDRRAPLASASQPTCAPDHHRSIASPALHDSMSALEFHSTAAPRAAPLCFFRRRAAKPSRAWQFPAQPAAAEAAAEAEAEADAGTRTQRTEDRAEGEKEECATGTGLTPGLVATGAHSCLRVPTVCLSAHVLHSSLHRSLSSCHAY
jgi:hypothetical protein